MNLAEAILECDEEEALSLVREKLDRNVPVEDIIADCNSGMIILGNRFEEGEAFIPDLMFGGMIMKKIVDLLSPYMDKDRKITSSKKLVIGTVQYDIHDIGKDITRMVFQCSGFETIDLGVDVPPERFVQAIEEHQPDFVGLSLLLTTSYQSVFDTVEAICNAGLRSSVKICIGGAAATPLVAEKAGCDFYGKTAIETLRWARDFKSETR